MREIKRVVYNKDNSKWREVMTVTNKEDIYKSLATDIIAKKIHKCLWIKSIRDVSNYDGTRNITVYYDNECKCVYTVEV